MNKSSVGNKTVKDSYKPRTTELPNNSVVHNLKITDEFEVLPTPVKSASDKKEYRVIRLRNGLTACLISDPSPVENDDDEDEEEKKEGEEDEDEDDSSDDSEQEDCENEDEESDSDSDDEICHEKMAAAGLCIGVGSFSDPKKIPGMAHFLEHMVFMGSEKFPEENDFDSFLSKRGGSDNASTDCEVTTFYFECLEKDLYTALDKFAQFFISPLMKRGSITREREAIESEFQMALPSDTYRKEQLVASFATDGSPVNTFTWGNLITLRDNVSEDELYAGVHEFRKRHYSAHRMTLAIQARLPIDTLQSYVLDCFSKVPSNDLPPDDFQQFKEVYNTRMFSKLYYVQPVNDIIQLNLTWSLPSLLKKYKSKPNDYVSWFIGNEGKGSLLAYLRKKIWVLALSAGNDESGSEHNSMFTLFTINMSLTKESLERVDEIIAAVFSYINMLKKTGPLKRYYDEMKMIADTSFKFATEEPAVEIVEDLSENMHFFPPEDYLTGPELFFEYDPEAIKMVLDSLTPKKMNIMILSKTPPPGMTYNKTEKWFGTKYTDKDIPQDWLHKWEKAKPLKEFALPPPNVFLTKDFSLLKEDESNPEYPEKVLETNVVELWYRKDQKFKLPIAYYNFYFITPVATDAPKSSVLLDFYKNLMGISFVEEAYPAQLANLSYSLQTYDKGLILEISGYNEKLHALIELISKYFVTFNKHVNEEMFKAVKDKLTKSYYNSLLRPSNLAKDVRLHLLINNYFSLLEKYNVVSSITFEDLKKFSVDFMEKLFIKVLVQGNVTKDHAVNVVNNFVSTFKCSPLDPGTYPYFRVCQLPVGETFCVVESFNTSDSNSIITTYYQSKPSSIKESVIIDILMLIIQEPLFDTLRTKEQLGYDVHSSSRDTFGILGFSITVNAQATKNTTGYVESRIEKFLKQTLEFMGKMSEEAFESTKKDLIKTKRILDGHLKAEVNRNWSEITDEDYMFDRIKREIEEIEKLKLSEVQEWWSSHISKSDKNNFRKLSVQVAGFKNAAEDNLKSSDMQDKDTKIKLKFVINEDNNTGAETQRSFIKDVTQFKKSAYLYPVVRTAKME